SRVLLSLPTRRSSYLLLQVFLPVNFIRDYIVLYYIPWVITSGLILPQLMKQARYTKRVNVILITISLISIMTSSIWGGIKNAFRSEEHTSELKTRFDI